MPLVHASGVPDLTSRHGLPEGIILVGHNNLIKGLAIDEELATAVNGTMSDLVSMEQTRYPWLTGQRTGEQSFSLVFQCCWQSLAEP